MRDTRQIGNAERSDSSTWLKPLRVGRHSIFPGDLRIGIPLASAGEANFRAGQHA